jgi:hypothetical protein
VTLEAETGSAVERGPEAHSHYWHGNCGSNGRRVVGEIQFQEWAVTVPGERGSIRLV